MRKNPFFKKYKEEEDRYIRAGIEPPAHLHADYSAKLYMESVFEGLHKSADGNAISNAKWSFFENNQIIRELNPNVSAEVAAQLTDIQQEIVGLYADLKEGKEEYFIDNNTLTRLGRKRVRASADAVGQILFRRK